jgi:transcriptional regulator with XRE-family HTH domain
MDQRGIGRRELELGADLSRGYVSRMLAGTRVPRVGGAALTQIAKFLRVRWRWLGVGAGSMEQFVASGVKQRASAAEIAIAYNRAMVSDEAVVALRAEAVEWGAERDWSPPQWGRRLLEIQASLATANLVNE